MRKSRRKRMNFLETGDWEQNENELEKENEFLETGDWEQNEKE